MQRQCFLSNYNDLPDCIVKTMNVLDNIQIASVCGSIKPTELVTAISPLNVTDFSNKFRKSQITTVYVKGAMTKPIFGPLYSKTCGKRATLKKTDNWRQDQLSLNTGQKYCRRLQESILQYFRPSLSYHLSLRYLFCHFLSGRFKQVLQ